MGQAQQKKQVIAERGEGSTTDIESFIGYNLKRAYMVVQEDFRAALGPGGMAPRVFSALSLVVRCPNITQSELARRLGIERSGLVAMVDDLQARGLLKRVPVPSDRRVQALVATPSGHTAYTQAHERVKAHERKLLADISPEELDALNATLRKIRNAKGSE